MSLKRLTKDASPLLDGEPVFSEDIAEIKRDELFDNLLESSGDAEFQILTQQALELLCGAILLVLERQFQDQLPGGKYADPSPQLKMQASSVPTSNIISERDFSIFGNLLREKLNARVLSLEAMITWAQNKPSDWLDGLDEQSRAQKHKNARKMADVIRQKMKQRRKEILSIRSKLEENRRKQEEKKSKMKEKKISISIKVEKIGGIWKNETDVKQHVKKFSDEKQKKDALFTQLQFHQLVLNSNAPKSYFFQKSHTEKGKKVDFRVDDMTRHLIEIVKLNLSDIPASDNFAEIIDDAVEEKTVLLYEQEGRLEKIQRQKKDLLERLRGARIKRGTSKAKEKLTEILANPSLLVGKKIKHRIQETEDDLAEWYDANIIRIDEEQISDSIRTTFDIYYDIDGKDQVFTFPLIKDLKRGHLIIMD